MNIHESLNALNITESNPTLAQVNKAYKRLCVKYHPDRAGKDASVYMMQLINEAVKRLRDAIKEGLFTGDNDEGYTYQQKAHEQSFDLSDAIKQALDILLKLEGLNVELCGTWLWISGDTKTHKDAIKSIKDIDGLSVNWNAKKLMWAVHSSDYRKRTSKTFTHDEVRTNYGSHVFSQRTADEKTKPATKPAKKLSRHYARLRVA